VSLAADEADGNASEAGDVQARRQRALDVQFMREALEEARQAADVGEVPVGAVVVHGSQIITRAHNTRELENDPTGHAELTAMREASRLLRSWRLVGCTLYVTLEPCFMCAGAIVNARVERVVFGAHDPKAGAVGSLANVLADERLNHAPEVVAGVEAQACGDLLREFFRSARQAARAKRDA
jgi:tRNA(adenine34) deaminase